MIRRHAAVFNVLDYGAKGDGVTDDTAALRRVSTAVQAAGGGTIVFPPGNYILFTGTTGSREVIFDLTDLRGVKIVCDGVTFTNARTFTANKYGELFRFTGCYNIEVGDIILDSSQALPDVAATNKALGFEGFNFYGNAASGGCKNIRMGNVKARNIRAVIVFYRLYNDPEAQRCTNIHIENMDSYYCAYTINAQFSGDGLRARINANGSHRTYSVYGVRDHQVFIQSRGNDGNDAFVGCFSGVGCEDMHVYYINKYSDSTTPAQPAADGMALYFGDQTPGTHRNINFYPGIKYNEAGGYLGAGIEIYNSNNAGAYDTVDRGHTIDGLRISGWIIGNPGPGSSPPITSNGSWGAGNYVRNVKIENLYMSSTASATLGFLGSLNGPCTFNNVLSDASIYPGQNPSGFRIAFVNCRAQNFTSATSDTGYHDYYGCEITDGSLQSIINKRFEAKTIKAGNWQPNSQEWIGVYSANATSDARILLNDGVNGDPLIPSANMGIESRMLAPSATPVTRNLLHSNVFTPDDAVYSAVQAILSQSNNISSRYISWAILSDGSLSLRYQDAGVSGIPSASTLLANELVNIASTLLSTGLQVKITKTGGGPTAALIASAAAPAVALQQTSAAADNKIWDFLANATVLEGRAVNDANSASGNWFRVSRTGTTIDLVDFPGTAVKTRDLKLGTAGDGLYIKEGTNATMGVATLSAGAVTVNTTKVTANSRIHLTIQSLGTVAVPKAIGVTARTAGTSFTITSADATDTSVVAWQIVEPA